MMFTMPTASPAPVSPLCPFEFAAGELNSLSVNPAAASLSLSCSSNTKTKTPECDAVPANGVNLFEELVLLVKEHDALVAELETLKAKLQRTSNYLQAESSKKAVAKAYHDRLKRQHSAILSTLRANRHLARRFLQKLDAEAKLD